VDLPSASRGFTASVNFTSNRPRPIQGAQVVQSGADSYCAGLGYLVGSQPYYQSLTLARSQPQLLNQTVIQPTTAGGTIYQQPSRENIDFNTSFALSERWAMQWSTNYDFQLKQFAQQSVTLRRELHDWDAVFSFVKSPNGNFSFHFFVSLKAEPDLKFDYDRRTRGRGLGSF
jgi:hypothetical protein